MTRELISRRTRTEFREFLVRWTLREIGDEFACAHIAFNESYRPDVSGERRAFVEQHYCTLDPTKPGDVRRLLAAFGSIIERAEKNAVGAPIHGADDAIATLKASLVKDGLVYVDGAITASSSSAKAIFETQRGVTEITRRAIFDELSVGQLFWSGRLSEREFLARLYDLEKLPSYDGRFQTMAGDIGQHRELNSDWEPDWAFSDDRLDLLNGSDEQFLRFLCETAHPVVRPELADAKSLVAIFNSHLVADGWELVEGRVLSGRPVFVARKRPSGAVALPDAPHSADVLSDEYVRELSGKCDSRLAGGDFDGAITVARTLLEAILFELELRLSGKRGEYKGDLAKQFKQVTKLLRMDDARPDLDDRFKDVVRGLVMIANGLAPLRNRMSDGHARTRKPALHHARVVVNASKTVSAFLVESYVHQVDRGLLQNFGRSAAREL